MITSTFTRKVGDVTVQVHIDTSDTFHVIEMSPIVYEFDMQSDAPSVESVSVLYSKCDLTCRYLTDGKLDLFDTLIADIGEGEVNVDIIIDPVAEGVTWKWRFSITGNDVRIDEQSRIITLALKPITKSPRSIEQIITDYYEGVPTVDTYRFSPFGSNVPDADDDAPCLTFAQFVDETLKDTFINTDNVIDGSGDYTTFLNSEVVDEEVYFIVVHRVGGANVTPPFELMRDIAAMECSLFGTGFDRNFWIHKKSTNLTPVELDENDVRNVQYALSFTSYNVMSIDVLATNDPIGDAYRAPYSSFTNPPMSLTAKKRIDLLLDPIKFNGNSVLWTKGMKLTGTKRFTNEGEDYPNPTPLSIEKTIVDAGLATYRLSLNKPIRVEFEARGMHVVKPWLPIKFAATMPSRYQGRIFRAYSLSYNVEMDTAHVKAYQIGTE